MEYRRIKDQDKDGFIVEDDVESLRGRSHSGSPSNVAGFGGNSSDLSKWKRKSILTLALTLLTSSQAILIVWSKREGKYEYSVTTANFLVEALKCAISLAALVRIWGSEGVTEDNRLSEIQWAAFILLCAGCTTAQLNSKYTVGSDPRWCCTYLLDATDPLFVEIGRAFIRQQLKEYGRTSHIYNCDTFDEITPPDDDPEYISALAAAIFESVESGDVDAVWLMQGWLFTDDPFWKPPQMKALLHSVPVGKLVVLDLYAEVKPVWATSEQFYGVPYIWCMLHNFAGNLEMLMEWTPSQ